MYVMLVVNVLTEWNGFHLFVNICHVVQCLDMDFINTPMYSDQPRQVSPFLKYCGDKCSAMYSHVTKVEVTIRTINATTAAQPLTPDP